MPKVTVICYLSSLLFYGMGYSKMLILKNADVNTYDFTSVVSLATAYFVLTIFLALIGSFFLYVKTLKGQETHEIYNMEYRVKENRRSYDGRRGRIFEIKAQLSPSKYVEDLERRMSS